MTSIFVISVFAIIVIFDIIVLIKKKETITSVLRKWYKEPLVPYIVSGIFIGHIGLCKYNNILPINISLWIFIVFSILWLAWCIIMKKTELKVSRKFYVLCCKIFLIPMIIGAIIGSFWI